MEYLESNNVRSRERSRIRKTNIVTKTMVRKDHFDFSPYEGKVVRVNDDKTYFVKNGKGISYPIGTIAPDGKSYGWDSVQDVYEYKDLTTKQKLFSKTGVKALKAGTGPKILQKTVGNEKLTKALIGVGTGLIAAPFLAPVISKAVTNVGNKDKGVTSTNAGGPPVTGDPIVTTSVTTAPTNSTFAEQLLQKAQNAAPELKDKVIEKGQEYLTDKLGQLSRDPSMLPKTKKLKQAELFAQNGGSDGPLYSETSMGFSPTNIAIGVGLILLVLFMFKQNS